MAENNGSSIFNTLNEMRNCKVLFQSGKHYVSFEMFLESNNEFLVACVAPKDSKGRDQTFYFVKIQNAHNLNPLALEASPIIAVMSSDWISGLTYSLNCRNDEVAKIRSIDFYPCLSIIEVLN